MQSGPIMGMERCVICSPPMTQLKRSRLKFSCSPYRSERTPPSNWIEFLSRNFSAKMNILRGLHLAQLLADDIFCYNFYKLEILQVR
jgi:hypothetical protein